MPGFVMPVNRAGERREPSRIHQANRDYYDSPGIPESYARRTELFAAEKKILAHFRADISAGRVLDLGVGSGRTAPYLSALAGSYVAADYSTSMLNLCKALHGNLDTLLCDAREMSFKSASFDVVFFCWNAIDDVSHRDRIRILREVRRVLEKGGLFIFSSHNLDIKIPSVYVPRLVRRSSLYGALRINIAQLWRYFLRIYNHSRNRKHEEHTQTYSIINDPTHSYRLFTYYIRKENQIKQLESESFRGVDVVAGDGSFLAAGEPCTDPWIYYVARRG